MYSLVANFVSDAVRGLENLVENETDESPVHASSLIQQTVTKSTNEQMHHDFTL